MPESKANIVTIMFMTIFGTLFFSGLFQINVIMTIFYFICFLVSLAIYMFGYSIRRNLVQKFRNPLKVIIKDLMQFDKVEGDSKLKRKIMNRLYKQLKLTEFLEGSFKVIPSNSPTKPSFRFQIEGENPLLTIQFFILTGDHPYQFQISGKHVNYYSNLQKQAPSLEPEVNTQNLESLITILKEFIPQK